MHTWPFQKPVPLSVGETAGQTADRRHGLRGCTPASLQEPQAPRQSGGPPPRPGSRPRGQSGEPAPLPAGRPGAAGDPVSLSLPCSHEVGGHSAQARHDVPELWASAVQAHEVSAGRAGSERPGPGLCRGGGREPALGFRGTRSVCPQRCSGCTTGDDSRVLPVTAERAPSQLPPRFPPSALMTQPRPDGSPLPGGSACCRQGTRMWAPKRTSEGGDSDPHTPHGAAGFSPQRPSRRNFRFCGRMACVSASRLCSPTPKAARRHASGRAGRTV